MSAERTLLRLVVWPLHRLAYRLSGGRLASRPADVRTVGTLVLTTVGRRSGQPRPRPLYYTPDGDNFVVVASNAGDGRDPDWWLNLGAHPEATVRIAGEEYRVRARQAEPAERERLWPELLRRYPRYERYTAMAGRAVPVVILERVAGAQPAERPSTETEAAD